MKRSATPSRYAFIFSRSSAYPPNIHNMKCYYLTRKLLARGDRVTWVRLGGRKRGPSAEGIAFANIPIPPTNVLLTLFSLVRMVLFCFARGIQVAYIDEWLFFRHRPFRLLAGIAGLRAAGIKVVLDERDPSVDFEVATGELSVDAPRYRWTLLATRLSERLSNLVILTSKAYEQLYISEGFPPERVEGDFRGVDTTLFNPNVDSASVRSRLGLEGKFVIGWFGLMHPFRLIKEVLVPIIGEVAEVMPNAHVLIGGEGPMYGEFQTLARDQNLPVTVLGLVPYADLPRHIAACDVLLCTVKTGFRHTLHSTWLKIAEALAVGRPVIATRTKISDLDFKDMKGVVWVEPSLAGFLGALKQVRENYPAYFAQAQEQARHFEEYSVSHTIGKIVDRIELLTNGHK
jgi:glycosyltransferase involved in cell wall biosynthesis